MIFKESCRYSDILEGLLKRLGAKKVLFEDIDRGWSGHLDCDVLLKDGRVFSYKYYYGSCQVCDKWEQKTSSDEEIEKIMAQEATMFDTEEEYYSSELYKNVRAKGVERE